MAQELFAVQCSFCSKSFKVMRVSDPIFCSKYCDEENEYKRTGVRAKQKGFGDSKVKRGRKSRKQAILDAEALLKLEVFESDNSVSTVEISEKNFNDF